MATYWDEFIERKCESPIETMLGSSLFRSLDEKVKRQPDMSGRYVDFCYLDAGSFVWNRIVPQSKLAGYRIDFGLLGWVATPEKLADYRNNKIQASTALIRAFSLAIECDGHEFHEKTKEQVARDKARDRAITLRGVSVVRFSGSEIFRDADGCAAQVFEMMEAGRVRTLELIDRATKFVA